MRTTLNIDDQLLDKAARLTGTAEKTALVRMGLESLIALHSAAVGEVRRIGTQITPHSPTPHAQNRMILVDTSVWIDHLRSGNRALEVLLEDGAF